MQIGSVGVGGDNPIRIQSMTTSPTQDVQATVAQILRLAEAGCEIARVTVQGMKEADACEQIKNQLVQKGCNIPLVADIHFFPKAAMRVVDFIDKVRINPGNYVDPRASFRQKEYDDATYAAEIERIEEKFSPLVEKCLRLNRAMRIGTNHGSLSDRIMNRYGDTPFGMVESAFEFARVCRKYGYHNFLFSMKASNPVVMLEAYRLLVAKMIEIGWDYPLHLGVTEAGEGEEGRIKSAIGSGTLLLDGLGDTLRISLTEDPWEEIDPCQRLIRFADCYSLATPQKEPVPRKRVASPLLHKDGSVVMTVESHDWEDPDFFEQLGCSVQFGRPVKEISTVDGLICQGLASELPKPLRQLQEIGVTLLTPSPGIEGTLWLTSLKELTCAPSTRYALIVDAKDDWTKLQRLSPEMVFFTSAPPRLHEGRRFFSFLAHHQIDLPVLLHFSYTCSEKDLLLHASAEMGALLADGLGEGVALRGPYPLAFVRGYSFSLLQAVRMRTSKTEFISCPGCGRTLFDLQTVARRIREKTAHLPGVKIAIMGCIVNGPGEMADADFGYVGSKPGKIDLYIGKTCVQRDIEFDEADERLIELIKAHGRWVEPVNLVSTFN